MPVVRDVLPRWDGRLVVEVPGSEERPGRRAGRRRRAATPTSRRSRPRWTARSRPGSQVHVFVNPDVYDDLEPVGGQVVISHEATHLATRRAAHQRGAAVAARGVRRLRRPARRRPAAHDHGRPDHRSRSARTARPDHAAGPARVRPGRLAPRGGVRERLGGLPGARRRGRPGRAGAALRAGLARPGRSTRSCGRCSASPRPS